MPDAVCQMQCHCGVSVVAKGALPSSVSTKCVVSSHVAICLHVIPVKSALEVRLNIGEEAKKKREE